jgi:hypothetical protein
VHDVAAGSGTRGKGNPWIDPDQSNEAARSVSLPKHVLIQCVATALEKFSAIFRMPRQLAKR